MKKIVGRRTGIGDRDSMLSVKWRKVLRPCLLWRLIAINAILILISGCSNAHITDIVTTKALGPQPEEILVDVDVMSVPDAFKMQLAREIAIKLQADLIQRLQEAKLTAKLFAPGAKHPGTAILHVAITEADKGNAVTRMIVGFGMGQAALRAKASFVNGDPAKTYPMTAFNTSSDSGSMPGLVVPGGVALASGHVISLAIGGGIRIADGLRDSLDKPVRETSLAIVKQLKKYYASVGWRWPDDDIS